LHRQFSELCKILKEANFLDLKLNTNATVLDEKKIHDILSANFSEVIFSVDAGTKETYEKIRVLGKFERVVDNIKLFNNIRSKHYPNSPTVTRIAGVKVDPDQDLEQMAYFWSEYVDEVTIKEASPRWDSYNNKKNSEKEPCLNLWYRMYIWYDGTANPCDFDYKSFLKTGNVSKDDISKIWQNEFYSSLRNDHLCHNRKKRIPCDRCPITT
jgi:radical SAM protein with 4Fe4S-binding SPASM domain